VIAKICLVLLAHFFGRRFLAVLGVRRVVLDAHFADVQLGIAGFTDFETTQGQAERRERGATAPTNQRVSHATFVNLSADPADIPVAFMDRTESIGLWRLLDVTPDAKYHAFQITDQLEPYRDFENKAS